MNFTPHSIWSPTGLRITADGEFLTVEDLNPEAKIKNRVSRWELFRIGFWLMRRATFF